MSKRKFLFKFWETILQRKGENGLQSLQPLGFKHQHHNGKHVMWSSCLFWFIFIPIRQTCKLLCPLLLLRKGVNVYILSSFHENTWHNANYIFLFTFVYTMNGNQLLISILLEETSIKHKYLIIFGFESRILKKEKS